MPRINLPEIEPLITAQLSAVQEPVEALLSAKGTILKELHSHPKLRGLIGACIEKVPGIVQAANGINSMLRTEVECFKLVNKNTNEGTAELQKIDETYTGWLLSMPEIDLDPRNHAIRTAELKRLLEGGPTNQWTLDLGEFNEQGRWSLLKKGLRVGRAKVFYEAESTSPSYQALQGDVWHLGKSRKKRLKTPLPQNDADSARFVAETDWYAFGPLYSYGIRYNTNTGEIQVVRGLNAEGFDF